MKMTHQQQIWNPLSWKTRLFPYVWWWQPLWDASGGWQLEEVEAHAHDNQTAFTNTNGWVLVRCLNILWNKWNYSKNVLAKFCCKYIFYPCLVFRQVTYNLSVYFQKATRCLFWMLEFNQTLNFCDIGKELWYDTSMKSAKLVRLSVLWYIFLLE